MLGLSKFCAVLLITLTVSPVTAPFAACDLSAIVGDGHTAAVVVASLRNTRQNAPPILRL